MDRNITHHRQDKPQDNLLKMNSYLSINNLKEPYHENCLRIYSSFFYC